MTEQDAQEQLDKVEKIIDELDEEDNRMDMDSAITEIRRVVK